MKIRLRILCFFIPLQFLIGQETLSETQDLKFQDSFFEALKHKAIGNSDKAILSLEKCLEINPNDGAINFEMSKNYYTLNQYEEALHFAEKTKLLRVDDPYVLEHTKRLYTLTYQHKKAIETQKQIIAIQPNKYGDLVSLYLRDKQRDKAISYLEELESKKMLTSKLRRIYSSLKPQIAMSTPELSQNTENNTRAILLDRFKKNKTFKDLKLVFESDIKEANFVNLKNDAALGLTYFPAQPYVYLMHAKGLFLSQKTKKALINLDAGMDFIIENKELEKKFYSLYIEIYKSTENLKNVQKFEKKLNSL